jgi:hypothetical protein
VVRAPALVRLTAPRNLAIRPGCREPGWLATVNNGNLAARPLPGRLRSRPDGQPSPGALPRRMAADEGTWPGTPAQWPRSGRAGARVASHPGFPATQLPGLQEARLAPPAARSRTAPGAMAWLAGSKPPRQHPRRGGGAASARLRAGAAWLGRLQSPPGQDDPRGDAVAGAAVQQAHQARVKAAGRAGTGHEHRVVPASADRGAQHRQCRGAAAGRPRALAGVDGRCRPPPPASGLRDGLVLAG